MCAYSVHYQPVSRTFSRFYSCCTSVHVSTFVGVTWLSLERKVGARTVTVVILTESRHRRRRTTKYDRDEGDHRPLVQRHSLCDECIITSFFVLFLCLREPTKKKKKKAERVGRPEPPQPPRVRRPCQPDASRFVVHVIGMSCGPMWTQGRFPFILSLMQLTVLIQTVCLTVWRSQKNVLASAWCFIKHQHNNDFQWMNAGNGAQYLPGGEVERVTT